MVKINIVFLNFKIQFVAEATNPEKISYVNAKLVQLFVLLLEKETKLCKNETWLNNLLKCVQS